MCAMANSRVLKRKTDSNEPKVEPARKALKKNELHIQYKALQEKYDIMKKQNARLLQEEKKHIESICLLEETVKLLEERDHTSIVEKLSVPVQTEIINVMSVNIQQNVWWI